TPTPQPTDTPIPIPTPTPPPTPTPIPTPTSTDLGGIENLDGYCQSLGYSGANHNPANANDWYCIKERSASIDMNAACNWQYHRNDLVSRTAHPNDPNSWQCYGPQGDNPGGVYNLDGYCQAIGYSGANHDAVDAYGWRCIQQTKTSIVMTQACQWTYKRTNVVARTVDQSNPYLWQCWTT
ncbi:MAG TPA: hypothetical protein VKR06_10445, partial [Ktedonosporobacter sp.]|nr:hypothetical protein [Ktedonosporobacter sp.]